MQLKMLGKSRQIRGRLFEKFASTILTNLDYRDFKRNVIKEGMEFDIKATHRRNNTIILCECKSHKKPIGPKDLQVFLAKFISESDKGLVNNGLFISTSGFTGNATEFYDTLSPNRKSDFSIVGSDRLVDLLEELDMLLPEKRLDKIIRRYTKQYLGQRYLVYFEFDLFVVQLLKSKSRLTSFIILTAKGNIVDDVTITNIIKAEHALKNLRMIKPFIIDKVAMNLLDLKEKSLIEIANEIRETTEDVKVAGEELLSRKVLIKRTNESNTVIYSIKTNLRSLQKLANWFCNSEFKYDFMFSKFIARTVNSNLINHIMRRFKLHGNPMPLFLRNCCLVFPSVLDFFLNTSNKKYLRMSNRIADFRSDDQVVRLQKTKMSILLREIGGRIMNELDMQPQDYLSKKGVYGYLLNSEIKFASENELLMGLGYSVHVFSVNKPKGPLQAGDIVQPKNVSSWLPVANNLVTLEDYLEAMDYYVYIIENTTNALILCPTWNGLARCYRMTGKVKDEEYCRDVALFNNHLTQND